MINIFEFSSHYKLKNFDKKLLLKQYGSYLYVDKHKYKILIKKTHIRLKRHKGFFEGANYIPPVIKCYFIENEEKGIELIFYVSWLHIFLEIISIIFFLLSFVISCIMFFNNNININIAILLLSGLSYFLLTNLYLHFFFEKEKQFAVEDLESLNFVK